MIQSAVENETPVHVFLKKIPTKLPKLKKQPMKMLLTSNLSSPKKLKAKPAKQ
jgi:hypothetical protein